MIEGFLGLSVAAFLAGLVRGFSGFGTAMVFLPIAGQILTPFQAVTAMIVMDAIGPLPNVPRALKVAHRGDILRLALGYLIVMPLGVWVLLSIGSEGFRYGVSALTFGMLVILLLGIRYRGAVTRALVYGIGGLAGLSGGAAGLAGPPVILFYMASAHSAQVIRANILLFLLVTDVLLLGAFWVSGKMVVSALLTGLALVPIYGLANLAGAAIFRPGAERTYRAVAYFIIAAAALSGLPLWD
jgi:uncharacterized protein